MKADLWVESVNRLLAKLHKCDFGYPLGTNALYNPRPRQVVVECLARADLNQSIEMLEFYANCDGVTLPDIHNGYFIKSVDQLADLRPDSEPIHVTGSLAGPVRTFGSTGGGGLFVIRIEELDILYLPPGPIHDGVYQDISSGVRLAAENFPCFLERLLNDVSAFVENSSTHQFMV